MTNSMCASMLMEIIKTLRTKSANSLDNQDSNIDKQEENVFEDNNEELNPILNYNINKPVNTFGLLDKIKTILYKNMKKYYLILTSEPLIFFILDS